MRNESGVFETYRDFASAFGTAWLLVIALAFLTGGQIGRWGALILPIQFCGSLAYAIARRWRRRAERRPKPSPEMSGARYVPI